ncbi:MAG: hypothetical protein JXQ72_03830 [Anaerolineae bacterium]|nr:hypothetical protein [Anaerolineae bacterium]
MKNLLLIGGAVILVLTGILTPPAAPATAQTDDFLDQLAEDTWNYLLWAQDGYGHHLPWSWRSDQPPYNTVGNGDYANPTEIGLLMLCYLGAYEMRQPWSPDWPTTEAAISATLDQLEAWQNDANSYQNSVFYQGYHINNNPPTVGPSAYDHIVPSIDNAFLAASLLVLRQAATHSPYLIQKVNGVLDDMNFLLWYDRETHLFYWGGSDDSQDGGWADYWSNENRIINVVAYALGQLGREEYLLSLDALTANPSPPYAGITVEKVNWDGSYFTYTTPAMFLREMGTPYGTGTINPATQAQIAYATNEGYTAWGLSDCFGIRFEGYMLQGAPPSALGGFVEQRPGLVTPHTAALALMTGYRDEAITTLQFMKDTFKNIPGEPDFYHPVYGFRDSVMADPFLPNGDSNPDYGVPGYRFSMLGQGWIFLSIANDRTGFLWDYFYWNDGVRRAHQGMFGIQESGCYPVEGSPGMVICGSD